MSICPICREIIPHRGATQNDCPACRAAFQAKRFKFKLPEDLNLEVFEYCDYMDIGDKVHELQCGLITPEEYDTEMNELVKTINARAKTERVELDFQTKRQRSADYAKSLLNH